MMQDSITLLQQALNGNACIRQKMHRKNLQIHNHIREKTVILIKYLTIKPITANVKRKLAV